MITQWIGRGASPSLPVGNVISVNNAQAAPPCPVLPPMPEPTPCPELPPAPEKKPAGKGKGVVAMGDDEEHPTTYTYAKYHPDALEPSAAFLEAWEKYKKLHAKIMDPADSSVPKRYVNIQPEGQLCNRLRATSSGLLVGMLTNRALKVSFSPGYYTTLDKLFADPGIAWDGMAGGGGSMYSHEDRLRLVCEDMNDMYPGESLSFHGAHFIGNYLFENAHYREILDTWFPRGNMAGVLSRTLFKPNAHVQSLMDGFIAKHKITEDTFLLALQIRSGLIDKNEDGLAEAMKRYTACIEGQLRARLDASEHVVTFVATDTQRARDIVAKEMEQYNPVFFGDTFLLSNNDEGCQAALVDLLMLSKGNTILTSPGSSYGEFARAHGNLLGHEVNTKFWDSGSQRIWFYTRFQFTHACLAPMISEYSSERLAEDYVSVRCYDHSMLARIP